MRETFYVMTSDACRDDVEDDDIEPAKVMNSNDLFVNKSRKQINKNDELFHQKVLENGNDSPVKKMVRNNALDITDHEEVVVESNPKQ